MNERKRGKNERRARTVKKTNGRKELKDKAVIASLNSIKTPHLFPIANSSMVLERESVQESRSEKEGSEGWKGVRWKEQRGGA